MIAVAVFCQICALVGACGADESDTSHDSDVIRLHDASVAACLASDDDAGSAVELPAAKCDPTGTWHIEFASAPVDGCCQSNVADSVLEVSIERDRAGRFRSRMPVRPIGDDPPLLRYKGSADAVEVSADGCAFEYRYDFDWVNNSESGSCHFDVSLSLAGECANGQLAYREDGFCGGSTSSMATAVRIR